MYLEQLEYIRVIAAAGSFSQAAARLYMSQPALSMAVRHLEEELGYSIFERRNTGIRLTEKGSLALDEAVRALDAIESLRAIGTPEGEAEGDVLLVAFPAFYNLIADDIVVELLQSNPGIRLHVEEAPFSIVRSLMDRGERGLAVMGITDEYYDEWQEYIHGKKWHMELLYEDDLCVFIPKHHPLAQESGPVTVDDLDGMRFAAFEQHMIGDNLRFFNKQPAFKAVHTFKDGKTLKHALAPLEMVTVLPGLFVWGDPYLSSQAIVKRPLSIQKVLSHVLIYPSLGLSVAERVVRETIRKTYRMLKEQKRTSQ